MAASTPFPPSDHCDGHHFHNPRGHLNRTWADVLRWRRTSRAQPWAQSVAVSPQRPPQLTPPHRLACTWINHATFLLQTTQGNVLIDPIYSRCAGPLGPIGPARVHPPGVAFPDLPTIDFVLLSHDHYDHCDLPTLRRLARRESPWAVTLLGNGALLRRAGFAPEKIIELDWWESHTTDAGMVITATPSRHWSNRLSGARNGRLWGGFHLQSAGRSAVFVGDTGYDAEFFSEIRKRLGAPDLAMVPIGAYEPRWFMEPQHCNPDEAVQIHLALGATQSVAMHWGTFQLTDEARDEPPQALAAAKVARGVDDHAFRVLQPGESLFV